MAAESQRLTDHERANLVAYLDGELSEPETRALSTKITQSVTGRREIDALQKTWALLDFLPKPEPSNSIVTKTLTKVRLLDSREGRVGRAAGRVTKVVTRATFCIGTAAITLVLGYVLGRWAWPDPTARLVRDLPIAEHFDEYREIGGFEFLEKLDHRDEFLKDAP